MQSIIECSISFSNASPRHLGRTLSSTPLRSTVTTVPQRLSGVQLDLAHRRYNIVIATEHFGISVEVCQCTMAGKKSSGFYLGPCG